VGHTLKNSTDVARTEEDHSEGQWHWRW